MSSAEIWKPSKEVRQAFRAHDRARFLCWLGIHRTTYLIVRHAGKEVHVHTCACGKRYCCKTGARLVERKP